MTKTRLNVLLVEDSIADAQLTLLELRRGGFDPIYERVDTPEAMKASLQKGNWEIILSDYVMPRFSGPAALKLVRELGIDLPVIVVTGQVGEETAVETMKAGANDYVLKGNLARLVPAIRRELGEAQARQEHEQAEEALRLNLDRYQRLADTAVQLLSSDRPQEMVEDLCRKVMDYLDCHAFFNYLNDERAGRLHLNACAGIPAEEAEKIQWLDYGVAVCGYVAQCGQRVVAEQIPIVRDPRTDLVASYGIRAYACHPLLGPEGKIIGTLSFGTRSRDTFSDTDLDLMKKVTGYVAIAMQRIQSLTALRESEERFRAVFEQAAVGIGTFDLDGRWLQANTRLAAITGYTQDELRCLTFQDITHQEDLDKELALSNRLIAGEIPSYSIEKRYVRKDESIVWANLTVTSVRSEGVPGYLVAIVEDITDHKRAERALLKSEQRLQLEKEAHRLGVRGGRALAH